MGIGVRILQYVYAQLNIYRQHSVPLEIMLRWLKQFPALIFG